MIVIPAFTTISENRGGPLLGSISIVVIVSILQQGHTLGLNAWAIFS